MKILIADDERKARYVLQSMLEELYPNEHTFYQVENGLELIDKIRLETPDIAFVDIKMPKMDGLSALRIAKESSPETIFLILSGFAEFDFAKQALRLGVKNYLLKPVSRNELAEAMKHVTISNRKRIEIENNDFRLKVITAFNTFQALGLQFAEQPDQMSLCMFVFYLDSWNHGARNKVLTDLTGYLQDLMKTLLNQQYQYAMFFQPNGELCMVVKNGPTEKAKNFLEESVSEILLKFGRQATAFFCMSDSLKNLFAQGQQIMSLSCIRSIYSYGKVIDLAKMKTLSNFPQFYKFSETLEKVCLSYAEKNLLIFKNDLESFQKSTEMEKIFAKVDTDSLKCYLRTCLHIEAQTNDFSDLIQSIFSNAEMMFKSCIKEKNDIIGEVKKYVEAHYSEQIGINTISELLDITPNYLSKIFHERSGERFMDFLTRIRIDNAKILLLQHSEFTIKTISEKIGYLSTQYFIKIFFKTTGYLPSEYQNRFS